MVADAFPGVTISSVETLTTGSTKRTAFVSPDDGRDLVLASAVDSRGRVTRPRYPELGDEGAAAFHRRHLLAALDGETRV